jgi:hypothetical protein
VPILTTSIEIPGSRLLEDDFRELRIPLQVVHDDNPLNAVDALTLQEAQRMIAGCEACSEDAALLFENILDRVTRNDPSVTDYFC